MRTQDGDTALSVSGKVAIVAALKREVHPLIRNWHANKRQHEGRRFKFFESEWAVLVCGGIGAEAARRASEAVIAIYHPSLIISAGFAGALDPSLLVGNVLMPRWVIDAGDGSRTDTGAGVGALISIDSVAGPGQKAKLAKAYDAQAVDMEAAAVARGAQARGVRFVAIKAISDESNFVMPPMKQFVNGNGEFNTSRFVVFALVRPWLWLKMVQLARNASRAARALCESLEPRSRTGGNGETLGLKPLVSQGQQ
jgi:adenosylhomocysteine nucleosidase